MNAVLLRCNSLNTAYIHYLNRLSSQTQENIRTSYRKAPGQPMDLNHGPSRCEPPLFRRTNYTCNSEFDYVPLLCYPLIQISNKKETTTKNSLQNTYITPSYCCYQQTSLSNHKILCLNPRLHLMNTHFCTVAGLYFSSVTATVTQWAQKKWRAYFMIFTQIYFRKLSILPKRNWYWSQF